jgi:PAS domain S-box-containing protein
MSLMDCSLPEADPIAPFVRVLDALPCGASLVDRAGRIVFMNERFCDLSGRSREQAIGQFVWDLYSDPDVQQRVRGMLDKFDKTVESEFFVEREDGVRVPVISAAKPLIAGDGNTPTHRLVTVIDITRQKEAMEEVTALSDTVLNQAVDLKRQAEVLEEKVRERTAELHDANMEAIYMLAIASEARDEDTGTHVQRIHHYARALAMQLGLPRRDAERVGHSAILHDVGKIQIPDSVLKKPGRLTDEERSLMQQHTVVGESILSEKPFFAMAKQIARSHHENWDGSSYPDGLGEHQIPLPARIVHVVDVFDALRSPRVYKPAWSEEESLGNLADNAGRHFDPTIVQAFAELHGSGKLAEIDRCSSSGDGNGRPGALD